MKINKSDLIGTGSVYRFTLLQMVKGKANIITLVIFLLLAAGCVPLMALAGSDGERPEPVVVSGMTEDQMEILSANYSVDVMTEEEYRADDGVDMDALFVIQYVYSIFVMFVSIFSASYIIRAVIEEKASKLVETLMVSVKPLALILGKILSVMTYIFGLFVAMILAFGLSYGICGRFMDVSAIGTLMSSMGFSSELMNLSVSTVLIVLISLILGYLAFSIIAGVSGTCCSSMEDMESANLSVTLLIMAGYLVSCMTVAISGGVPAVVVSLLPVVSVFCAPVQYVVGHISLAVFLLSWLLQALYIVLLAIFATRVYRELIMYRGNRVKLMQLFRMAGHKQVKEVR